MKNKFTPDFNTALTIAQKYGLNTDNIVKALDEIPHFRVTAPVIGGFSTGKSSLINAVIGEKLLSTNITAETAVPTEITCGSDTATLVSSNGSEKTIPLSEFNKEVLSASDYSVVKINTSNEFFGEIPSIKLVDMPGFDSGIDVHNKAIDNYLPQSLAYILTVAADEGTLRASIKSFLNELKLYDMPVYTVITKAAKSTPEDVDKLKAHIVETLKRFLKIDDPKIAVTTAKGNVDVNGFREFLLELQSNSDDIFNAHFKSRLALCCREIEKYLTECLDKNDLTLDDLKLQKEQAERAFEEVGRKFGVEKERFRGQVEKCVSSIKSKIIADMEASRSTIEHLILQGQENAIRDKINSIIRNAYTYCIQTELEPRVKNYICNVENSINVEVYSSKVELSPEVIESNKELKNNLVTEMAPIIGVVIGDCIPVIGPFLGMIIGSLLGVLFSKKVNDQQKAQKEQLAREKASEIIDGAANEAGDKIAAVIYQYVDRVDESLAAEIEKERELKSKALSDCEEKLRLESDERERKTAELKADLETIRSIVNGNR